MPPCTLKFLAKFLRNSSDETLGFGKFSFFSACLITEPSILNFGVEVLSIGIGVIFVSVLITASNKKKYIPLVFFLIRAYTFTRCSLETSTFR